MHLSTLLILPWNGERGGRLILPRPVLRVTRHAHGRQQVQIDLVPGGYALDELLEHHQKLVRVVLLADFDFHQVEQFHQILLEIYNALDAWVTRRGTRRRN